MRPGITDLIKAFSNPRLIFFIAWSDIRARYKRSVLGPIWITITTAIGVTGLGLIWSYLFKMDRATYVPLLTVGLILWQFIATSIGEAASVFNRQANLIRNLSLPLSLHPAQLLLRQMITLAHTLPLFFIVSIILGQHISLQALWAIPNLILVIANLFWMILLVGILGARFRDLEYFVGMVMPMLMFFTPVMYRPNALPGVMQKFMWLNPLGDMIEIVRYPLLGQAVPLNLVLANVVLLIVGGGTALAVFNAKRNRLAFWV